MTTIKEKGEKTICFGCYEYCVQVEDSDNPYLVKYEPHFKKDWYNLFSCEAALDVRYEFHIPENAPIRVNVEE